MKNYIKIDGKKVEISDETANNFKKMLNLRAKKDNNYYSVNSRVEVDKYCDFYDYIDDKLFEIGNYFLNKEDAENVAEKLKLFWKSLK